ncbi:hypothetical protein PRIPAC_85200 [Pristionchus pacificus]|uniref:Uncharacterized protein n=1 Tax=Pristionchus pacificus TaxID=54126 RepID=A0A2A6C9R4_PRIPA|nr:hypothetical protein PRIPAC_85200 [Pristionchus pacificus]|eukprot:PDM74867.1 hypothetical protein PRIPAC_43357 [Pristionchus pacificus]
MLAIGVPAALGASLLFGSVFVPIKRAPTGDGFFAQLMMCLGGLVTAVLINGISNFPPIYPLAMLGGCIWCIGNAFAIKIMSVLGMALGVLIWNTTSCLTGWAVARFGLFGIRAMYPASNLLNAAGVFLLIVGGVLYLFIKSDVPSEKDDDVEKPKKIDDDEGNEDDVPFATRIVAILAALISGTFYGSMSTPITYIQQNSIFFGNAPVEGLPYILSFFCGVIVTSVVVFIIYTIRSPKPYIEGPVVVPALCSGAIFAVSRRLGKGRKQHTIIQTAMSLFLTAIEHLSQTIAYPLCAMLPGLIASAWSVLYFKEIKGSRNIAFLVVAYGITLIGVILVALSKEISL